MTTPEVCNPRPRAILDRSFECICLCMLFIVACYSLNFCLPHGSSKLWTLKSDLCLGTTLPSFEDRVRSNKYFTAKWDKLIIWISASIAVTFFTCISDRYVILPCIWKPSKTFTFSTCFKIILLIEHYKTRIGVTAQEGVKKLKIMLLIHSSKDHPRTGNSPREEDPSADSWFQCSFCNIRYIKHGLSMIQIWLPYWSDFRKVIFQVWRRFL